MRLLDEQETLRAASLLQSMSAETAALSVKQMSAEALARIIPTSDPVRMASLFARLEPDAREERLSILPPRFANELKELMSYPEGTAGQIMDPRFFSFRSKMTCGDVLQRLNTLRERKLRDIFLVDDEGKLVGAVPLHDAVLAPAESRLETLITTSPQHVSATASQEEIVQTLRNYRLSNLPVVDFEGHLVGLIRQNALIHAVQEEATAGIQTMVGAGKEERALSKPTLSIRKRLPWLNINLLTAFLAAAVVGMFENTIAQFTALAVLLPVVAGQSGNTGAQALAVTMRGLALWEIRVRHWPRILLKEATVGAVNGIAVALVTMLGVYVWSHSLGLCAVIGMAMVFSMIIAGISGAAIPVILTSLGQDPAQSSSIILTTVTDVFGFFSFLGLATLFAGML